MQTQRIMTHAQWIDAGGWEPSMPFGDDAIVIALIDDETGAVEWASWDDPTVDPATRLNPDFPAVDSDGGPVTAIAVVSTEQLTGLPIPEPAPVEITLADVAAALRDPLANLTPSSESTTVRTAILNQRVALDALLAATETP